MIGFCKLSSLHAFKSKMAACAVLGPLRLPCRREPVETEWTNKTYWVVGEDRPCPGQCDPAYAMDGKQWHCGCGRWDIVQEAPKLTAFQQVFMSDPRCRALLLAEMRNELWGDIAMRWADEDYAALSAKEKLAVEKAKAGEAAATAAALQAYDEAKVVSIVAPRPVPKDKRTDRYGRAICCQYHAYKGKKGELEPATRDAKTGTWWPAGCAYHSKKRCAFTHNDEAGWDEAVPIGAPPPALTGRVQGTAPTAQAQAQFRMMPRLGGGGGNQRPQDNSAW